MKCKYSDWFLIDEENSKTKNQEIFIEALREIISISNQDVIDKANYNILLNTLSKNFQESFLSITFDGELVRSHLKKIGTNFLGQESTEVIFPEKFKIKNDYVNDDISILGMFYIAFSSINLEL